MRLYRKIPVIFEEEDYEIRILYEEKLVNVVAFRNNHPANGYRYQLQLPQDCDVEKFLLNYPVQELVDACSENIRNNRWETVSKAIQRSCIK